MNRATTEEPSAIDRNASHESRTNDRSSVRALSRIEKLACAALSTAVFFAFGMLTLERGHPEEDAYIMFRYADHVAAGRGIVFNPSGPPAEGATDFLWMLMLSALDAVGVDVAVAAVVLNAIGAGLAAVVLASVVDRTTLGSKMRLFWLLLVSASIPFLSAAMAAYGCFSSMLYAGIAISAVHLGVRGSRAGVKWLPAVVLVLALFRPDGVVLAGPIALIGALRARLLGVLRPYLMALAGVAACGASYFVWRYSYFGLPLPLPLYVKSRVGDIDKLAEYPAAVRAIAKRLPGLGADVHWLVVGGVTAAVPVAGAALFMLYRAERSWPELFRRLLGALPAALLFASLAFAYQTQNFQWRFQAPIQLAALYFAVAGTSAVTARRLVSSAVGTAMVAASVGFASYWGVTAMKYQLDPARGGYLNTFAARYGRELTAETRVALTEAGRFPFWSPAKCLDTIGLNSPEAAVRPVTSKMLTDFAPHILLFHHAMTVDLASEREREGFFRIRSFRPFIRDRYKEAFDKDYEDYKSFPFSSVKLPSLVMERYLEEHMNDFEVFAVDLDKDGNYGHIFGFRKDTDPARALKELRDSLRPENDASYLALRKEQAMARADGAHRNASR